jgi:hypothetical protein
MTKQAKKSKQKKSGKQQKGQPQQQGLKLPAGFAGLGNLFK